MTKTIDLPADLAAKVEERVASGAAKNPADVVRAGLEALEAEDARKLEALRAKVGRALSDPRPSRPADEVFDDVEALVRSSFGRKLRPI
jgi:antitoxin ParD1/3/4